MHFNVHHLIHQYGYAGIFFALLLEMIGIPFPGETLLTLSGVEWTKGNLSFLPLLLVATMGNIVGSSIAYAIGRFWGRPVILRFGKVVRITNEKLDQAQLKFRRYSIVLILVAKFIAGIRVLVAYIAGMDRMPFISFTIYNTIASLMWVSIFLVFGRYVGVAWEQYHQVLHQYMLPAIFVLVVMVGFYWWMKNKKKVRD